MVQVKKPDCDFPTPKYIADCREKHEPRKPYTNTPSEPDECEKHETPYLFKFGYCASSCLGCSPEHSNCTSSEDQKTYGLLTLRIGTVNQPLVYATVGGTVSKSGDDARWLASGTGPAGTALFKASVLPKMSEEDEDRRLEEGSFSDKWNALGSWLLSLNLFGYFLPGKWGEGVCGLKPGGLVDVNVSLTPKVPVASTQVLTKGLGLTNTQVFGPQRPDLIPANGGTYPPILLNGPNLVEDFPCLKKCCPSPPPPWPPIIPNPSVSKYRLALFPVSWKGKLFSTAEQDVAMVGPAPPKAAEFWKLTLVGEAGKDWPYYKLSPAEAPQGGGPYYLSAGKQPEDDGQYRAYVSKTELDEDRALWELKPVEVVPGQTGHYRLINKATKGALFGDADRHSDDAPHDVFVEPAASDCAKMNGKDVWQINGVV